MAESSLIPETNSSASIDLKKMAEFVGDEFERYERATKDRFEKAQSIYDHWIGVAPKRSYSWQNAVHVPITFEA